MRACYRVLSRRALLPAPLLAISRFAIYLKGQKLRRITGHNTYDHSSAFLAYGRSIYYLVDKDYRKISSCGAPIRMANMRAALWTNVCFPIRSVGSQQINEMWRL